MQKNSFFIPSIILGIALIVSVVIGAFTFIAARGFDNTLAVTGSASEKVVADNATWSLSLSRQASEFDLGTAYSGIARDLIAAKKFLAANGIAESAITVTPAIAMQQYKSDQSGPREFDVRQTISVQSNDPQAIDKLSKSTDALTSQGMVVTIDSPQYYYTKLSELRVSLLGAALTDARARAQQIAGSAGTKVGALKSASSGVVQVLSPNSIDVSDYGQYDTSSINKNVMVTVRATFFVK
ncbi:MAG: SIMPL domain-containing protein [Candidatus Taylorbacteria bacterium]